MTRLLTLTVALTLSMTAGAQEYRESAYGGNNQLPDGASGEGVVYTQRALGHVIAVGSPITQNFVAGQTCTPVQVQAQPDRSPVNAGTFLGALVGGLSGSLVGRGRGQGIAIGAGAAAGAIAGNEYVQGLQSGQSVQAQCVPRFETRVIAWTYTLEYHGIQVQGRMNRQPQIGENVEIIVRSTFYAGS